MATCEKIPVVPLPPPTMYRLDLTSIEAEYLLALLCRTCVEDLALDRADMDIFHALCGQLEGTRSLELSSGTMIGVQGWAE